MINRLLKIIFSLLLFISMSVSAKTIVLIHGLDADRNIWYEQKTVEALYSSGFEDASKNLFLALKELKKSTVSTSKDVFYTINLPWFEPIESQAKILKKALTDIYKQRQEPIILVGHSVGGLVARFYLLSAKQVPINGLITIATPHLGSPWAEMAWRTMQSPIGDFLEMMGTDKWTQADKLLWQLSPNAKTSLVHWMNRQKHPNIYYISIIHSSLPAISKVSMLVSEVSQNMNFVPALYRKSVVFTLRSRHKLSRQDGVLLAKILGSLKDPEVVDSKPNIKDKRNN